MKMTMINNYLATILTVVLGHHGAVVPHAYTVVQHAFGQNYFGHESPDCTVLDGGPVANVVLLVVLFHFALPRECFVERLGEDRHPSHLIDDDGDS